MYIFKILVLVFILISLCQISHGQCDTLKFKNRHLITSKNEKERATMILLMATLTTKYTQNMMSYYEAFMESLNSSLKSNDREPLKNLLDSISLTAIDLIKLLEGIKSSIDTRQFEKFAYLFSCKFYTLSKKFYSIIETSETNEIKKNLRNYTNDFYQLVDYLKYHDKELIRLKNKYQLKKYKYEP